MTTILLACSLLMASVDWAAGGTDSGPQFPTEEADAYPSHLAGFFDLASVDLVNLTTVHNRLSLFEPVRLSLHGFSWTSLHYDVDGVHLWHPFLDGEPTVAISAKRFGGLRLKRRHGALPRLEYLESQTTKHRRFVSEMTLPIRGTTLLPHGFMDREPALPTSTPRRQENLGYRLALVDSLKTASWHSEVGLELNQSDRQFPTLLSDDGEMLQESAWLAQGDAYLEHLDSGLSIRLLGAQQERPYAGGEYRFSSAETSELTRSDFSVIVAKPVTGNVDWATSVSWSSQAHEREGRLPPRDLAAEWMQLQRRIRAQDTAGLTLTSSLRYHHHLLGADAQLHVELGERIWERRFPEVNPLRDSVSWQNGDSRLPISLSRLEEGSAVKGEQGYAKLVETLEFTRDGIHYDFSVGGQTQWVQALKKHSWAAIGIHLGAALEYRFENELRLNVGLGLVPQEASTSLVEFLDDESPSGHEYRWNDDGDFIASDDETGELIRRFGGRYHRNSMSDLMPHHLTWTVGIGENAAPGYFWYWQGTANLLVGQATVNYDERTLAQFEAVEITEPGGDGLGEDGKLPDGGQALTVYARNGEAGNELYELGHLPSLAQFWGMSLEFGFDEASSPWMWKVEGTAYLSLAQTPFGIFSDRNDVGVVDEASADPNAQVNRDGRSDACRAFGVNIDVRYRFHDNLRWFLFGRYRDGQPFTRIWVEESLPQGPVAIMAVGRGDPVPRFTFHMTLDTAVDWRVGTLWGESWFLNARLTNLLNSGTELLEELRTGDNFRKSLEMVPTRALWLTLRVES